MATTGIFVNYNGVQLFPTPLVNYVEQPVTFGYLWGYNQEINLEGYASGISVVNNVNSTATGAIISSITNIFTGQFGTLQVTDDIGNTLYNWSGVTVDSISFEPSLYFQGSFIKYNIKLLAFGVPSGVMEPANEYSFVQNEDGTVNVNHKISARGVRNSAGAFSNAILFVQQFTGKDPWGACAPYFVPSGSGVLLSLSENIDRSMGSYSVNEVYKYSTGTFLPYATIESLDTSEDLGAEFKTMNYSLKYFASPIYKNLDTIINTYLNTDTILNDISNLYGFNTSNWVKSSYSAVVDSGASTVDIKIGYVSGANPSGFFDYIVTCDQDLINVIENWKLEGHFRCFGPLDYKIQQFLLFKQQNNTNGWKNYLTGIITNNPLFSILHDTNKKFTQNVIVSSQENTQLGDLKLSCDLDMGYEPVGIADLKYSIDASPSRRIYELLPSANIEGSFVIQDLQLYSQPNQEFTLTCNTDNKTGALSALQGYLNSLTTLYVNSGTQNSITAFLIDSEIITGTYDVQVRQKYLGLDNGISSGLTLLQTLGTDTSAVPVRISGFTFGF